MTDIVSIMVEAAEAERAIYTLDKTGNPVRPYVLLKWGVGGAVGVREGYEAKCKAHLTGLVVQAQLRALHAAGLAVVPVEALPEGVGSFWRVKNTGAKEVGEQGDDTSDYAAYRAMIEAVNAIPVALRENG